MVDIVKLTSRLNEDSDNLPPVVVAIQNAFQESWLSQQEVQLLEEFEASSTDTNDYDDHDNDCQDLDSIVDDVPVDNQEAVVEEENNAQEQDGLMHFPIPSLRDDDENETNSLVVRLVALMAKRHEPFLDEPCCRNYWTMTTYWKRISRMAPLRS
jgi:hypothetical protein